MNEQLIYPSLLIVAGIIVSTAIMVLLNHLSKKIVKLFELYPESKGILNISFKAIVWFIGIIIFLIFSRVALNIWGLDEFTAKVVEDIIWASPKYILAILIILSGFYVTRVIRERSKNYSFEYRDEIILFVDFIIHLTFVFTALYSIGVNITFFIELYKIILWIAGAIIILVISMSLGIPIGMNIHEKMKEDKKYKKAKSNQNRL